MESNLKDRFDKYGSAPSSELWDRIESTLDEKKKRRPLFFWLYWSAAAIIVAGGFLIYLQPASIKEDRQTQAVINEADDQQGMKSDLMSGEKKQNHVHQNDELDANVTERHELSTDIMQQREPIKPNVRNQQSHITEEVKDLDQKQVDLPDEVTQNRELISERKTNNTVVDDSIKIFESDEVVAQKEVDSTIRVSDTMNTIVSVQVDSAIGLLRSTIRTTSKFEIGLTYSFMTSQPRNYDAPPLVSTYDATTSSTIPVPEEQENTPDTVIAFYQAALPLNIHLNFGYYFSHKWRLDAALGYSRFNYNFLDQDKNRVSHYPLIHAISVPLAVTFSTRFGATRHQLNYSAGIVNDLSPGNWNNYTPFYYALSTQMKAGYGYEFTSVWRATLNLTGRYTIFEKGDLKSGFYNRLMYGGEVGLVRRIK